MTKKISFGTVVGLALMVVMIFVYKKPCENRFIVACNLPLTGDISVYGESVRNGYQLAYEAYAGDLNRLGVEIDFQDNQGEQRQAITVFNRQVSRGYNLYVSGVTQQTLAIKKLVDAYGQPHVIWSFYPLVLSQDDNAFRTWLDHEPSLFLKYLKSRVAAKRVACVYLNAASGQELFNRLFIPMIKDEYEIVYNESFDIEQADFRSVVAKIKASNPDIIFVNGFQGHIIQIAKELHNAKVKKDGNVVFTFDLLDAIDNLSPENLEGVVTVIPNCIARPSKALEKWSRSFKKRFGRQPNYTDIFAFDGFSLIAEAIIKSRGSVDFKNQLLQTKMIGLTGELRFDNVGKMCSNSGVYKVHNGHFIPVWDEAKESD